MVGQQLERGNREQARKDPAGGKSEKKLCTGMHHDKGGENGEIDLLRTGEILDKTRGADDLQQHRSDEYQAGVQDPETLPTQPVLHLPAEIIEHEHLEKEPDRRNRHKRIGHQSPDLAPGHGGTVVGERINQGPLAGGKQQRGRDHGGALEGHQQGDQADREFPEVKKGLLFPGMERSGHGRKLDPARGLDKGFKKLPRNLRSMILHLDPEGF